VTTDPLHYVDSVNQYGFVGFDPINSWDPYGLGADDLSHSSWLDRIGLGWEQGDQNENEDDGKPKCGRFDACSSNFVSGGAGRKAETDIFNGDQYGFNNTKIMADGMAQLIITMAAPEEILLRAAAPVVKAAGAFAKPGLEALKRGAAPATKLAKLHAARLGGAAKAAMEKICRGGVCQAMCFTAGTPVVTSEGLLGIEMVEVGDRVPQYGGEQCSIEPFVDDLASCAVITLEFENPFGYEDSLVVELMRSTKWLKANQVDAGGTVRLVFEEFKVEDDGYVRSISSCPVIAQGEGCGHWDVHAPEQRRLGADVRQFRPRLTANRSSSKVVLNVNVTFSFGHFVASRATK